MPSPPQRLPAVARFVRQVQAPGTPARKVRQPAGPPPSQGPTPAVAACTSAPRTLTPSARRLNMGPSPATIPKPPAFSRKSCSPPPQYRACSRPSSTLRPAPLYDEMHVDGEVIAGVFFNGFMLDLPKARRVVYGEDTAPPPSPPTSSATASSLPIPSP